MSPFPIEEVRAQTRGVEHVCHFNNAGASLMPAPVADRLHDWLADEERRGGYEVEASRRDELEDFYAAAAELIVCDPAEVAFIENATRAWNMVFYGLALGPGDYVLAPLSEYGSNVIALRQQAARRGFSVEFIADDADGVVDLAWLEQRLADASRPVRLIALTHVPTGNGLINPAAEVGALARAHGVAFLLDACQSLGQLPLDVSALGADMLTGTGRKYLRGPRGTGLLYVRAGFLPHIDPPFLDQHAAELVTPERYLMRNDARRFECWERYCAGQAAFAVALRYAKTMGAKGAYSRLQGLAARLRQGLSSIAGVEVTDAGRERGGIVTFRLEGCEAQVVKASLLNQGINVSVSTGSGNLVWFEQRGLRAVVRASVHYFNTDEELGRLTAALRGIVATRP
ncbi:MAG: aminotransferase class V-fold PLP-dependent enzyme [Pseudomonadota bacterium]